MPRTLLIVERNADRFGNVSFIVQGKYDELTPMGLHGKEVTLEQGSLTLSATVTDATVRAGVLTLRFDAADARKLTRGAKIHIA